MRAVIMLAGAALTLTACGNHTGSDNAANADEGLSAENIVANDVTAIDAVTGDAANMAADVNYSAELDNNLASVTNTAPPQPGRRSSGKSAAPATPATGTSVANSGGNAAD